MQIEPRRSLQGHKGPVNTLACSKDGNYVLSGGQDRMVILWNAETGKRVHDYSGHGYDVSCIAVTHDSSRFASCGGDRLIFFWDVTSGQVIRRIGGASSGSTGRTNAVSLNFESTILASGGYDSAVRLWDLRSNNRTPLQVLSEAKDSITCIQMQDSTLFATSVDGHVRTYDIRKGEITTDYFGDPVTSFDLTIDGSGMLVSTLSSTLRLMDSSTGQCLQTFKNDAFKNESYRIHHALDINDEHVIAGDERGNILVWSVVDGTRSRLIEKAHSKSVLWIQPRPKQGQGVLTAGSDGLVHLWSL